VTFSRGPKPSKQSIISTSKEIGNGCCQVPSTAKPSNASAEPAPDQSHSRSMAGEVAEPPRIVSQSQQVGEVPRVILDQNRHIVPFSFFGSPERPRSADHHHVHTMETLSPGSHDASTDDVAANGTTVSDRSPSRPRLPEHSASWGTTTVNSKLREQVLREVFGPPTTHHHKGHAKGHTTLPRLRTPSHRKTHLSEIEYDSHRRNASIPADQWRAPIPKDVYQPSQQKEKLLTSRKEEQMRDKRSNSASKFEDIPRGLDMVKDTASAEYHGPAINSSGRLHRRHSGMGLRRPRNSVSGGGIGNLEYFDDDGYGGDGEDEVFAMENPSPYQPASISVPSSEVSGDVEASAASVDSTNTQTNGLSEHPKYNAADSGNPLPKLSTQHPPLNPKEAQIQNPDQRVVYFLLLEDLTAGMGRPCVLDLKMGTRQYGIEANRKKMESQRRKCKTTTSQQLGVRICGMQTYNVKKKKPAYEDKYFGRDLKAGREFRDALTRFLYDGVSYSSVSSHIPTILDKISKLESMVRRLPGYRFYASSLLMLYDAEPQKSRKAIEEAQKVKNEDAGEEKAKEEKQWRSSIELKIVDFANCVTGKDDLPVDAPCPPHRPDDIDRGYLRGLRTLRMYFQRILRDINQEEYVERGEGEAMALGLAGGKQGPPEGGIEDDAGEVSV
jgi:inositol-hexakisphosphate 5-kinase